MNRFRIPPGIVAILLLGAIALSRLPFLNVGYGTNHDAWRVAGAARRIAETWQYEASRLPGYPLHEIVCALFRWGGPTALNGLSAAFSVAAAAALWLIGRQLRCRDAALIALAFAATPTVFINSVSSKDYVWATAFVLWALYAAINRRPAIAGLLFGLAIGCRITSGAMLLPLVLILRGEQADWRSLTRFVACAGGTALLAFAPVFARYGVEFLTLYHAHDRPGVSTIAARGTLELWGTIGAVGVGVALISVAIGRWRDLPTSMPSPVNRLFMPALIVWAMLYVIAFFALPDQAGYLIPLVAPLLLILARSAARPALQFACACLLIAPWMDFVGARPVAGSIIADHRIRVATVQDVQRFVTLTEEKLPTGAVVVVGAWQPIIDELFAGTALRNRYPYLLTKSEIDEMNRSGAALTYATEAIRSFNYRVHGVDLAAHGARNVRQLLLGAP